jgi:hypothetical protein
VPNGMGDDEMIEVTQEDLDASADLIEAYWCGADVNMMRLAKETRNGHRQGAFPRAFTRHRIASTTALQAELVEARAEVERLRPDAERWQAFYGSERFSVMGAAGFDWDKAAVKEPRDETNWLHFTLNIWDQHPAGDDEQGQQGRAMLLSYVEYLRQALAGKETP